MHIYFSGIGGTAIGPLALIAKQAGFSVSGSDQQDSQYISYLRKHGINDIQIGQTTQQIAAAHASQPIDWLVHSSAVAQDQAELVYARQQGIRVTKRDGLIKVILEEKNLQMLAIAGTHGKTTTTAMTIWLFKQLGVPISYSVGAKISFGDMGQYQEASKYFVYEADEFDRNFLAFHPAVSAIVGVAWDHHEIFSTFDDYKQAFVTFIGQSQSALLWAADNQLLGLPKSPAIAVLEPNEPLLEQISLDGHYNRLDAWLAVQMVHKVSGAPLDQLVEIVNRFPGAQRRMEQLIPGLYSDYAHTPDKIRGGVSAALDIAKPKKQKVVIVFEPLHNRRQHFMINDYKDCFKGVDRLYWLPSYLAREDPNQRIIEPSELISHLTDPSIAEPAKRDASLKKIIHEHLTQGDMVVGMAGGGGDSLDEWLRNEFI